MVEKRTLRQAERLSRRVEEAATLLASLTYASLVEIYRRDEQLAVIDGYPRGGNGPGGSSGPGDPTGGAAGAREIDHRIDVVHKAVEALESAINESLRSIKRAAHASDVILHSADDERGRVSSLQGTCLICGDDVTGVGSDRLRRGWDPKCYLAWTRWRLTQPKWDDPGAERRAFALWRSEQLREMDRAAS